MSNWITKTLNSTKNKMNPCNEILLPSGLDDISALVASQDPETFSDFKWFDNTDPTIVTSDPPVPDELKEFITSKDILKFARNGYDDKETRDRLINILKDKTLPEHAAVSAMIAQYFEFESYEFKHKKLLADPYGQKDVDFAITIDGNIDGEINGRIIGLIEVDQLLQWKSDEPWPTKYSMVHFLERKLHYTAKRPGLPYLHISFNVDHSQFIMYVKESFQHEIVTEVNLPAPQLEKTRKIKDRDVPIKYFDRVRRFSHGHALHYPVSFVEGAMLSIEDGYINNFENAKQASYLEHDAVSVVTRYCDMMYRVNSDRESDAKTARLTPDIDTIHDITL